MQHQRLTEKSKLFKVGWADPPLNKWISWEDSFAYSLPIAWLSFPSRCRQISLYIIINGHAMCADHSKELIFSLSYKIDFFENKLVKNGTYTYTEPMQFISNLIFLYWQMKIKITLAKSALQKSLYNLTDKRDYTDHKRMSFKNMFRRFWKRASEDVQDSTTFKTW